MRPPFDITPDMLSMCTAITQSLGQYEGVQSPKPQPQLRRLNRIRTIYSSLAIEGNTLSEGQISDILENKRVMGPPKDILEVKNAIKAYERIRDYKVHKLSSLLAAHKIMMGGLVADAGKLRNSNVGIIKGGRVSHMAPKSSMVPELMGNLFEFLRSEKKLHPLIASCVFHYEFEFIHPFSDGNGRLGRLWQSALLIRFHPVFEYVPLENLIKRNQMAYYKALETSDKEGRSTTFTHFMLRMIQDAFEEFFGDLKLPASTVTSRLGNAQRTFATRVFSRRDYILLHKTISSATASRDLAHGVKGGILIKSGDKALARYRFGDE